MADEMRAMSREDRAPPRRAPKKWCCRYSTSSRAKPTTSAATASRPISWTWACRPRKPPVAPALKCTRNPVNAGEKMYQRAGVKLHHRGVPNAPPEGVLLHDKQDKKRIASSANVPETSSVASPSVLPLPQSILRPAPAPLLNP